MTKSKKLKAIKSAAEANEALKEIKRRTDAIAARVQKFNEKRWPHYEKLGKENYPDQLEVERLEQALEAFMARETATEGMRSIQLPAGRLALREASTVELLGDEAQVIERLKSSGLHELVSKKESVNKQAVKARGLSAAELKRLGLAVIERDTFRYNLTELEPLPPAKA